MRLVTLFACALALMGCSEKKIEIRDVWIRMSAVPDRPAAGYFIIRGGAKDQTLIAVTTPAAGRVEFHETMKHGPAMTMAPIGEVKIPAATTVTFAPGGKHLMLFDFARGAAVKNFPITFTFADGETRTVETHAIAAGDPPPPPGS